MYLWFLIKRESLREFYRGHFCLGNPRFTLACIRVVYMNKFVALHENLFYRKFSLLRKKKQRLRACSHGGGGPQVGEVPNLPVVKESQPSHAIFTTPGRWGEVSKCFQIFSTRS